MWSKVRHTSRRPFRAGWPVRRAGGGSGRAGGVSRRAGGVSRRAGGVSPLRRRHLRGLTPPARRSEGGYFGTSRLTLARRTANGFVSGETRNASSELFTQTVAASTSLPPPDG